MYSSDKCGIYESLLPKLIDIQLTLLTEKPLHTVLKYNITSISNVSSYTNIRDIMGNIIS